MPFACASGLWLALIATATPVFADGGTPRFVEKRGGKTIAAFTSPNPPRVGIVDVSVLVQDERTGAVMLGTPIKVVARNESSRRIVGVPGRATNRLMQAFELQIAETGAWRVEVFVEGEPLGFDMSVEGAPPEWVETLPWLGWPLIAVGLFGTHQWLSRRRVAS